MPRAVHIRLSSESGTSYGNRIARQPQFLALNYVHSSLPGADVNRGFRKWSNKPESVRKQPPGILVTADRGDFQRGPSYGTEHSEPSGFQQGLAESHSPHRQPQCARKPWTQFPPSFQSWTLIGITQGVKASGQGEVELKGVFWT